MFWKISLGTVILFVGLVSTQAFAKVIRCTENACTIEEADGTKRELSLEEVSAIKRDDSRDALENVKCKWSDNPEECQRMLRALHKLFPL